MAPPTSPTLSPFGVGIDGLGSLAPLVAAALAVTVVNQGTKTVTVDSDHHADFANGRLRILGSTGNDGPYTVVSATFDTDHTNIVVAEPLPDATADGDVYADTLQAAAVDGDAFQLQGKEVLVVVNGSGGALTVTLTSAPDNFGNYNTADNLVRTIPDGATLLLGTLSARKYADTAGLAQIGYSTVTAVLVGVLTFATTS